MLPNIFQVLASLFLLTCVSLNYAKTTTKSDIFSIIGENTLQRKLEFTVNDTLKSNKTFPKQEESKLLQYVSLVSDEMNEVNQFEAQNFKENSIQLTSSIVELSPDEIKFHEITFDDFENIKKSPVRLETVVPDGSDPNTIRIIYESKIEEIVLSGLAEINRTNYDFVFNITELTLQEEHERTLAPVGKVVTKSILETLTFKKFTMLLKLTKEKKFIRSPNRQILRQLANSWLVTIVNVVNGRFVRSKVMAQSQSYFRNYKNAFLQSGCSSVLKSFGHFTIPSPLTDRNVRSDDSEYDDYAFLITDVNNFSNFSSCSTGSVSLKIGKNSRPNDNYYSHALTFAFTYSSDRKFTRPFFYWTLRKHKERKVDKSNCAWIDAETNTEQLTSVVKSWSITLTIFTDKNGRKTDDGLKVSVDFELENSGLSRFDDLSNRFLVRIRSEMATLLQPRMNLLLMPSALAITTINPTTDSPDYSLEL